MFTFQSSPSFVLALFLPVALLSLSSLDEKKTITLAYHRRLSRTMGSKHPITHIQDVTKPLRVISLSKPPFPRSPYRSGEDRPCVLLFLLKMNMQALASISTRFRFHAQLTAPVQRIHRTSTILVCVHVTVSIDLFAEESTNTTLNRAWRSLPRHKRAQRAWTMTMTMITRPINSLYTKR